MAGNSQVLRVLTSWKSMIVGLNTLPQRSVRDAVRAIQRDVDSKARSSKDPYGSKWKKRKHRYPHPILNKTGHLLRQTKIRAIKRSDIEGSNDAGYALYHQLGTRLLSVRLLLPTARKGIPQSWLKILQKAISRQFSQHAGKFAINVRVSF